MAKIDVQDLHFSYQEGKQCFDALRGIDLQIQEGEFLCMIGPSGCGKSTLLRLLAGLEFPDRGTIKINGKTVTGPGSDRMIVFQDYTLFPWLTAEENVSFALRRAKGLTKREAAEAAHACLKKVGMGSAATRYPFQLSGGMQQRVAISRALAMDTDILLLDEPFGALDAKIRMEIQEFLLSVWQNGDKKKTVLFVTHDISEAILMADRILYMDAGKIQAQIPVALSRPRNQIQELKQSLLALFEGMEGDGKCIEK